MKHRSIWILIATLATCCALLCLQPRSSAAQEKSSTAKKTQTNSQAAAGKQTFETICAGCHGLDGQGGERGPNIVTRQEVRGLSDRELLQVLRDGRPAKGMPAFSAMGDIQLESVVSHLRGLQGKSNNAAALPGNPVAGKELFFGNAGCSSCHMIHGAGGFLGSDLSSYGAHVSPKDIRDAVLFPNKDNDPRRRAITVTTEEGKAFTGIVRNEDNFSLQLQTTDGAFHLFSKSALKSVEVQAQSFMPADYGSKLNSKQLDDLINYLVSVANAEKHSHSKDGHDNEDDDGE